MLRRITGDRLATRILMAFAIASGISSGARSADRAEATNKPVAALPTTPAADVRYGGVLQESFHYHHPSYGSVHNVGRAASQSTIAPAAGWYGYGFPVQTYRWGWFGAGRYYPRVVWHRGYYDDCCRWAYRQGY